MTAEEVRNKPCGCWMCQTLAPKRRAFYSKLSPELQKEFDEVFDMLFERWESDSMDLSCLQSKVEGSWPREDEEKYYERIGDSLYEVSGKLVEEKQETSDDKTE